MKQNHHPQHLTNEEETRQYAKIWASQLRAGDVICLQGDLGAGKTVFARALIQSLCNDSQLIVPSPTFTLVQIYETPVAPLWHFDLYRLDHREEIYELGWEDALAEGILLIEWPQRLDTLIPEDRLVLDFTIPDHHSQQRMVIPSYYGRWKNRQDMNI